MSSIEKLTKLEETGNYVFHGSPDGDIKVLEPRQAVHYPFLPESDEMVLDGEPAVSATPYADIATFRAMINKANIPFDYNNGFGSTIKGVRNFSVSSEKVLEVVKNKNGFVYVLDKKEFKPYSRNGEARESNMEWRSNTPVKPIDVVKVGYDDLPPREKIEITN